MKFGLARTKKFKKSFKKLHLKDNDEVIYIDVVSKLLNGIALDKKYKFQRRRLWAREGRHQLRLTQ